MFLQREFVLILVLVQVAVNRSQKYVLFQEKESRVNWYQALISCRSSGMDLVSIHSKEEQNALDEFLRSNIHNDDVRYWLGATNEGNGQFYWVTTGAKMVFTKWVIDQPDNYQGDQHCLGLRLPRFNSDYVEGGWDDLDCTVKLPYICQKVDYCFQLGDQFNKV